MRAKYTRSLGVVLASLVASCAPTGDQGSAGLEGELDGGVQSEQTSSTDGGAAVSALAAPRAKLDPALWSRLHTKLAAGEGQELIVELGQPVAQQRGPAQAAELSAQVVASLGRGVRLVKTFGRFPLALVHVDSTAAAERLLARDEVRRVYEDLQFVPQTSTSLPFIGLADVAEELGYDPDVDEDFIEHLGSYDRAGQAARVGIALVDGRVNPTDPALGCTGVATPAGSCRLLGYKDVAANVEPYSNHATTMAAIMRKAAPAANLYNVDVTVNSTASTSAILTGLSHVFDNLSSEGPKATRYYKFDESSGLSSPAGDGAQALTWTGTPSRVSGYDGNALSCDGDDSGSFARPVSADFSIAFWMRTSQTASTGSVWNQGAGIVDGALASSTLDFGVSLLGNRIAFGTGGTTDTTAVSSATVNSGAWTHVVATRKRGSTTSALKVYVNGVLSGSATAPGVTALADATNLSVCSLLAGGGAFVGALDELRLYAYELTTAEIATLAAPDPSYGVNVVSLSLGTTTTYSDLTACRAAAGSIETAVSLLRTAGIVTVVAAGNAGATGALSAPACLPGVISVGAVQGKATTDSVLTKGSGTCTQSGSDPNGVLCNSNSSVDLDLLAPGLAVDVDALSSRLCVGGAAEGALCTSDANCPDGECTFTDSVCVGGPDAGESCAADTCGTGTCTATLPAQTGTSVATAHAAAGLAILYAGHRNDAEPESIERAAARLVGGPLVLDARNQVRTPRLLLPNSLGDCRGAAATPSSFALDAEGGTRNATVEIEAGCPALIDNSAAPWITVSNPSGRVVQLVIDDNYGNPARTGTVKAFGVTFSVSQEADPSPPVTSLFAAQGTGGEFPSALGFSPSLAVTLQIAASDAGGTASMSMCIVNDDDAAAPAPCTGGSWLPYATSRGWNLIAGEDGVRYVHLWVRDAEGHVNEATTLTVTVDTVEPDLGSVGTAERVLDPVAVRLTPSGMTDAHFSTYRVSHRSDGGIAGEHCLAAPGATTFDAGTQTPLLIGSLTSGTRYSIRVCAVDAAGNASNGVATWVIATNDLEAPVGAPVQANTTQLGIGFVDDENSVVDYADDQPELVRSAARLHLAATDNRAVSAYCLSPQSVCTVWTQVSPSAAFDLPELPLTLAGDGLKTYYVKFRDVFGNESAQYSTTARLDATAPGSGSVVALRGLNKVTLSLVGATDAGGSVTSVVVARSTTAPGPANCASGDVAVVPVTGTSFTIVDGVHDASTPTIPETGNAIVPGTTYYYRVCARDFAGNTAAGVVASATPTNDTERPIGTLSIQGAPIGSVSVPGYTGSASVTFNPSVSDETSPGVANPETLELCVSTTALDATLTCPDSATSGLVNNGWQPATSADAVLAAGDGVKTHYYKFRDNAASPRNVSALGSVSIRLDTAAPRAGTLVAMAAANYRANLLFSGFSDANGLSYAARLGSCTGTLLGAAVTSPYVTPVEVPAPTMATARTYCVIATDGAGRSTSVTAQVTLRPELAAPTVGTPVLLSTCNSTTQCANVIKAGVTQKWTRQRNPGVTVTLTDENLTGGQICYATSNSASACTSTLWQNLTDLTVRNPGTDEADTVPLPKTLCAAGEAKRTYYVFARDGFGNVTTTGKSTSIYVDTVAPTGGTLTPSALSTSSISVKWTKPTDAGAGFPSSGLYLLCMAKGSTSAAASAAPTCNTTFTGCTSGTKLTVSTSAAATSYTHTGLSKNTYYTYALCRRDILGNASTLRKSVKTRAQ